MIRFELAMGTVVCSILTLVFLVVGEPAFAGFTGIMALAWAVKLQDGE